MTCHRPSVSSPVPCEPVPSPGAGEAGLGHLAVRRIIFGVMLAMLLGALDQTIVATALPSIGAAFGDFANLPWVATAYLLTGTVATPLYGKLSDIYGRRVMLLVSVAVFTVASVACALAPNLLVLVLARGLQGLGGGGLISLSQTIIADVVSPRERGRYQGQIATVFAASSVAGPVLGGFFAEHLHWSLIFWINVPLGIAALVSTDRILRQLPRHERRHRMDYTGAGLMMLGSLCLLLVLSWGGVVYPWASTPILLLGGAAAVLAVLFVWHVRRTPEPFLPLDLLTNPVMSRAIPAATAAVGTMVGLSIFLPLYFELGRGLSASQSGLGLIPLVAGVVCGANLVGRVMRHLEHYKTPALMGALLATLALAALAWLHTGLRLDVVMALLAVVGIGIGMVLPVCTVSIQNAVEPHRMGTATGAMTFFRQLGGAAAVAVLGALLLAVASVQGGGSVEMLGGRLPAAAMEAGFHLLFATLAVLMLVSLGFFWAMAERPLRTSVRVAAEEGGIGPE
nr:MULTISPECIES: MDR family MFS transporter [unclassified Xanthobacter]